MALVVQNLHASAGDMSHGFTSWGWKGPLEEGMATHCSILAWGIPRSEEAGGLYSTGL